MLIDDESLYLYNITLKPPTSSIGTALGSFIGQKKSQEIVIASSTVFELWKPDTSTGKLQKVCSQNAFGVIQSISKLSSFDSQKDFLVVTSDSGNISILSFEPVINLFVPIVQEPHSKNGLRRNSPGEYLAVDPYNRAIFIGAIERNKLVYKVQTSEENNLELSSPLEILTKQTLTLKVVALETDFENPLFVAIEIDYSQYEDTKVFDIDKSPLLLNYYELDLGLNYVSKKLSKEVPASANHLIALPSHIGGVLIACRSYFIYEQTNGKRKYLAIPIRKGTFETIIISSIVHKLKNKDFFILAQSTFGDLFKLHFTFNNELETVDDIFITYFDTIPVTKSLSIFKSGFLFADVANDNRLFYQFENLGANEDHTTLKASDFEDEQSAAEYYENKKTFDVRALDNLALVDLIDLVDPIVDGRVLESQDSETQDPLKELVMLTSQANISTLTYGIPTSSLISSPLPVHPTSIFTTKLFEDSENDEYLVISSSLASKTLILSIGEVVEEITDTEFILSEPTISVRQVGKSSIVQVYTNGVRHIRHNRLANGSTEKKATDWFPPAGISILHASANSNQVVIGLSNREIRYFAVDPDDDQLNEYQDSLEMPASITSLAILGFERMSPFAVIGCSDESIQVVSLQEHNCLEILSFQVLSANASSLVLLSEGNSISVHIGMENGLYVRTTLDEFSGKLSDTRIKYIGSKPVKMSVIKLATGLATLAVSSRPYIGHSYKSDFKVKPLLGSAISGGTSFQSEDIEGDAIVGIQGVNLVIFTLGTEETGFNPNEDFQIHKTQLRYSPRKIDTNKKMGRAYIIESQYGIDGPYKPYDFGERVKDEKIEIEDADKEIDLDYFKAFGYPKKKNCWSSALEVYDLTNKVILQSVELPRNERPVSVCSLSFESPQEYVVIGVSKSDQGLPSPNSESKFYTFKLTKSGELEFFHKTELDHLPTALLPFGGKLLAGMGNHLRLYDLGRKQLLRKASSTIEYLRRIVKLTYQGGDRIVAGDSDNSATFVKYQVLDNQFVPLSDDVMKRQITSLVSLDYDTVMGGDKFGNIFVSRIPERISKISDEDWNKFLESFLNGSGSRERNMCEFYLQDIPTSLTKTSLVVGGRDLIVYTGIQGTVGTLLPLASKQEIEFISALELSLRKYFDPNFDDFDKNERGYNTLGKDHLKFRSYYNPVKNVIDGDFIEKFYELPISVKIKVSGKLDRTPKEIERKISDLRTRGSF